MLIPNPENGAISGLQEQYGANALRAQKIRSSDTADLSCYMKTWSLRRIAERERRKIERKAVDNFGAVAVQWTGA